jgi:hypothetical protein
MTYWKHIDQEIRELDFAGMPLQAIADQVGLSVKQVLDVLDQIDDDVYTYAETAADLDAEFYGKQ